MVKLSLECSDEIKDERTTPLLESVLRQAGPDFLKQNHIPSEFVITTERHFYMSQIRSLLEHNGYDPDETEQFWAEFFREPPESIYEIFRRAVVMRGTKRDVLKACPSIHSDTLHDLLRCIPPRFGTWKNVAEELNVSVDDTQPMWMQAYFDHLIERKKLNEFGARMGTLFAMHEGAITTKWLESRPLALPKDYITNANLGKLISGLRKGQRPDRWEAADRVIHALGIDDTEWRLLTARAWLTQEQQKIDTPQKVSTRSGKHGGRKSTLKPRDGSEQSYDPGLPYPDELKNRSNDEIIAECIKRFDDTITDIPTEPNRAKDMIDEVIKRKKNPLHHAIRIPAPIPTNEAESQGEPPASDSEALTVRNELSAQIAGPMHTLIRQIQRIQLMRTEGGSADRQQNAFDPKSIESFRRLPSKVDRNRLTSLDHVYLLDSISTAVNDLNGESDGMISIAEARRLVFEKLNLSEQDYDTLTKRADKIRSKLSKKESKWIDKWYKNYPDMDEQLEYIFERFADGEALTPKQLGRTWVTLFDIDPHDFVTYQLIAVLEQQRNEAEELLEELFERLEPQLNALLDQEPDGWMLEWLESFSAIHNRFRMESPVEEPVADARAYEDPMWLEDDEDDDPRHLYTEAHRYALFQELWQRLEHPDAIENESVDFDFGQKQIALAGTPMGMAIVGRRILMQMPSFAIAFDKNIPFPKLPRVDPAAFDVEAAHKNVEERLNAINLREDEDTTDEGDVDSETVQPKKIDDTDAESTPEHSSDPEPIELSSIRVNTDTRQPVDNKTETTPTKKSSPTIQTPAGQPKRTMHRDTQVTLAANIDRAELAELEELLPNHVCNKFKKWLKANSDTAAGIDADIVAALAIAKFDKEHRVSILGMREAYARYAELLTKALPAHRTEADAFPEAIIDAMTIDTLNDMERKALTFVAIHHSRVGKDRKFKIKPEEIAFVCDDRECDDRECPSVILSLSEKLVGSTVSMEVDATHGERRRIGGQSKRVNWIKFSW